MIISYLSSLKHAIGQRKNENYPLCVLRADKTKVIVFGRTLPLFRKRARKRLLVRILPPYSLPAFGHPPPQARKGKNLHTEHSVNSPRLLAEEDKLNAMAETGS
jgi:hypothetical protein